MLPIDPERYLEAAVAQYPFAGLHWTLPPADDELMSGVDEVIKRGCINEDQLFVTGGSGGGVQQ